MGACLRYGLGIALLQLTSVGQLGTFTVNTIGSFAIGFVMSSPLNGVDHQMLRLLLTTGFLGGFTTFSAFSWESLKLMESNPIQGLGYVLVHVCVCLFMVFAGKFTANHLFQ